jgi:flagellum-specific peptidoglycan hydrolase FlgJ
MKKILLILLLIVINPNVLRSGTINSKTNNRIDYERLYSQLLQSGVLFPDIAFAQAVIESAHFKSPLFIRANNLFGMQLPTKRPTTAVGSTNGYSKYNTWHQSVLDYKLWQDFLFKRKGVMTRNEYLSYIKRWYAADPNYVNKIKNSINKYSFILNK